MYVLLFNHLDQRLFCCYCLARIFGSLQSTPGNASLQPSCLKAQQHRVAPLYWTWLFHLRRAALLLLGKVRLLLLGRVVLHILEEEGLLLLLLKLLLMSIRLLSQGNIVIHLHLPCFSCIPQRVWFRMVASDVFFLEGIHGLKDPVVVRLITSKCHKAASIWPPGGLLLDLVGLSVQIHESADPTGHMPWSYFLWTLKFWVSDLAEKNT